MDHVNMPDQEFTRILGPERIEVHLPAIEPLREERADNGQVVLDVNYIHPVTSITSPHCCRG